MANTIKQRQPNLIEKLGGPCRPSVCAEGEQCKIQNQAHFNFGFSADGVPLAGCLKSNVLETCLKGLPCPPPRIGEGILGVKVALPSVVQVGDYVQMSITVINYETDFNVKSITAIDQLAPELSYQNQLSADIYFATGVLATTVLPGANLSYNAGTSTFLLNIPNNVPGLENGLVTGDFVVFHFLVKVEEAPDNCVIENTARVTGYSEFDATGEETPTRSTNTVDITVYQPAKITKKAYVRNADMEYVKVDSVNCGDELLYKLTIDNSCLCAIDIAFKDLKDLLNNQFIWDKDDVQIYRGDRVDVTDQFMIHKRNNELIIKSQDEANPYIIGTDSPTNKLSIIIPGIIECCRPNICTCNNG